MFNQSNHSVVWVWTFGHCKYWCVSGYVQIWKARQMLLHAFITTGMKYGLVSYVSFLV